MIKEKIVLELCPHCKGFLGPSIRDLKRGNHFYKQVMCDNCSTCGPRESTEFEAANSWNNLPR